MNANMLFANQIPDPVALAGFLGCLFFLVAGINAVMKLVDRMKDKPPAGEVAKHTAEFYATKGELKDHVSADFQEHSNLWAKIGGLERGLRGDLGEMERRLNEQDEERTSKLHDRLNDVDKLAAALENSRQAQNEWLKRMDEKLDALARGVKLRS